MLPYDLLRQFLEKVTQIWIPLVCFYVYFFIMVIIKSIALSFLADRTRER